MRSERDRWIGGVVVSTAVLLLVLPSVGAAPKKKAKPGDRTTGLKLAADAEYKKMDKRRLAFSAGREAPPTRVDLSADFPPPGDQGGQGSCTGWAVAYGLKSYLARVSHRWDLVAGAGVNYGHVFSPAYVYNSTKTKESGVTLADTLTFIRDRGVTTWAEFPYDPSDTARVPGEDLQPAASRWRIKSWEALNINLLDIKQQIAQGRPVVIGAAISRNFKDGKLDPGAIWTKPGQPLEAHAMLLVGYDDDKRAFKLMNSWGTGWGEAGYAWLAYPILGKVVREAYVVTDTPPDGAPQPAVAVAAEGDDPGTTADAEPNVSANTGSPGPKRKWRRILVGFKIESGDVLGAITPIYRRQVLKEGGVVLGPKTLTGQTIGGGGGAGDVLLRDGAYVVGLRIKVGNYFGAQHVLSFQADLRELEGGAIHTSQWYGSGNYATEISDPIEIKANPGAFISGFDGTASTHTSGETYVATVDIVETSFDWYK
jgi:hypothetical protein